MWTIWSKWQRFLTTPIYFGTPEVQICISIYILFRENTRLILKTKTRKYQYFIDTVFIFGYTSYFN